MTTARATRTEKTDMSADSQELLRQLQAELARVESRLGDRVQTEVAPVKRELAENTTAVNLMRVDLRELRQHNSQQDVQIGRLETDRVVVDKVNGTGGSTVVLSGKPLMAAIALILVGLLIIGTLVGLHPTDLVDVLPGG